jgi:hypothetical protein
MPSSFSSRDGKILEKNTTNPLFASGGRAQLISKRDNFKFSLNIPLFCGRASFLKTRQGILLENSNLKTGSAPPGLKYNRLSSVRIPFFPVLKPTSGNSGISSTEKTIIVSKISDYNLYNISWGIAIKDQGGTKFRLVNDRSAGRNEIISLVFPEIKTQNRTGVYCTEFVQGTPVPTWNLYVPGSSNPVISISSPDITSFDFSSGWEIGASKDTPKKSSSIKLTRLDSSPLTNDLEVYVFCLGTIDKEGNQPDIIASKTTISPGVYGTSSIIWKTY